MAGESAAMFPLCWMIRKFSFRPLAHDDLELMQRWLNDDFVARWWPGWPRLEQVRAKYAPRIAGSDPTKCFIIELDGRPIGFIQCYRDPRFAAAACRC